jgi:hypothetical protein
MTASTHPAEPVYIVSGTHNQTCRRLWRGPRTYKAIRNHLDKLRNPECGWAYVRIGKARVDDDFLRGMLIFMQ